MPDPQPPTGGKNSQCRSPIRDGRAGGGWAAFGILPGMYRSEFIRRYAAFLIPLLLVCISLNAVIGCGSGPLAFDGGHIPVGGGATAATVINGTAYAAENYNVPIAGATVIATNTTVTGVRETQTTTTTATGAFTFSNGFPDASGVNEYQVTVTPPVGSNRVAQQISFSVTAGQAASVLVALPSINFNETLAASVSILQQGYQVDTGDTVQIGAELLDAQGNPLDVSPSLVYTGNIGVVNSGGLFTSTSAGVGTVSAYWYTGSMQLQSSAATITATKSTSNKPPPPPITGPI